MFFGGRGGFNDDGFGLFGFFVFEEIFGGELDKVTVGILEVRSAGKLKNSEIVTNSKSDFGNN